MKKIKNLLATDLDDTLVGDKESLEALLYYYETLKEPVSLAYITGRHRSSADTLIRDESLPQPDLLITDVGTRIYSGPNLLEDEEWKCKMSTDWYPNDIIEVASNIYGLTRQDLPNDRRVSFYSDGLPPAKELSDQLRKHNIPHTFIFSSNRDIDILPLGGGKGAALNFLVKKHVAQTANILVAGDSGNDVDMLLAGYPAVIVSNAHPELLQIEKREHVFRAKYPYAKGILEAWQHFYGHDR